MSRATIRMAAPGHKVLRLLGAPGGGTAEVPVKDGFALVPYPLVRLAMAHGATIAHPGVRWPPRKGDMEAPDPLKAGDPVTLPDGTELAIEANLVLEIPERFIPHFEAQGWLRLSQFA